MNFYLFECLDSSADSGFATIIVQAGGLVEARMVVKNKLTELDRPDLSTKLKIVEELTIKGNILYVDVQTFRG